MKIFNLSFFLVLFLLPTKAQTTIINPANATGTSGANGSFQAGGGFAGNGWTVVNPGAGARWFLGTQSSCAGTQGAYVGTTAGNNNYVFNTTRLVHFYDNVTFPAGQTCITLSFNWKCAGENGFDGIRVSLGSAAVAPIVDQQFQVTDPSATVLGNNFYNQNTTCSTVTITIPPAFAGTTRRLVFSWINDASVGANPAATIDAVSLISNIVSVPSCVASSTPINGASNVSICGGSINWTPAAAGACNVAASYDVYFGTTPIPVFIGNQVATTYTTGFSPNTTYYYQIVPRNPAGPAVGCPILSFTPGNSTNGEFNLIGTSTSSPPFSCATLTTTVSQQGCAWDANSTINFSSDFTYDFEVNLGSDDAGADGMTFVFQNDPRGICACGGAGFTFGAGGITNSVIVEIDTYLNFEDRDDFIAPFIGSFGIEDPDHIDIWINGNINPDLDFDADLNSPGERIAVPNAVRLQNPPGTSYNIENGLNHILRVSWNAGTQSFTAQILNTSQTLTFGTISTTFDPLTAFGTNTPRFGFTAATGGLSNNQSFCLPPVLLPIELLSFNAKLNNSGRDIDVFWTTASENNASHFEVEKLNGSIWEKIGITNAVGTSSSSNSYMLLDKLPNLGNNIYRLKSVDNDGAFKFSDPRIVILDANDNILLAFPNPAANSINLSMKNIEHSTLQMFDAAGRIVDCTIASRLENVLVLDVNHLVNGIYTIKLIGNQNQNIRVAIQH